MSSGQSLLPTFIGALEGTASVLLTILAGWLAAKLGLLDEYTTQKISNICTDFFLPCLLVIQMGPNLTPSMLKAVWVIPVWGFASTLFAHGIGWLGQWAFKFPKWTILAAGRANSSALPLLLLEALGSAGVLDHLKRDGETTKEVLDRAKALILLNVIVQQVFSFAIGPSILLKDKKGAKKDALLPGPSTSGIPTIQDHEHVGLLQDHDGQEGEPGEYEAPFRAFTRLENAPNVHWPEKLLFLRKPIKMVASWFNPPVVGGIVALIIGMVTPLHHAFLDSDGIFYNSVTISASNLGGLFVALQMFTVGALLQVVPSANPKAAPTTFVLLIRYIVMPAVSLGFVFLTANRGWYQDDPLVWFLLVLIPAGPSAMVLASLAELVDTDQGPIVGYLTVAYIFSPLIAVTCAAGIAVVKMVSS